MFYAHTRSLGAQSGVQQNPLQDDTEGLGTSAGDQVVSLVARFKRGRIDKPFKVTSGNLKKKLGAPESLRVSALNEAYVQLYEAVNSGAAQAVVMRLSASASVQNQYAVVTVSKDSGETSFAASAQVPTDDYLFYLKDLECFNDGIQLQLNAPKVVDNAGQAQPTKVITLRVCEPDGTVRYEVTGSLDVAAVDEYGNDYFIGSVIESITDTIQIHAADGAQIPVNADCYGRNTDGSDKFATTGSAPLVLFTEGGTAYTDADYDTAVNALERSPLDYGNCFTAGTEAISLISKLIAMNTRANRLIAVDVPGDLTPEAAQTFVNQLNVDTHYASFYWAPLKTTDPVNGGKAIIGTSGFQVGQRCARNANTNSYGLAPKNYPIAGAEWPLNRTGVEPLVDVDDPTMSDLANAKINPVLFESYDGGGKYVFRDSLTAAKVSTSYKKLISVADMSSSFDNDIAMYGNKIKQLPMDVAIDKMQKFLKTRIQAMLSSGWLVSSDNPNIGDKGGIYSVTRNAQRPADRMDVLTWCHYDGVARAIYTTQTLSQ